MSQSLLEQFAELSDDQREIMLAGLPIDVQQQMARGEWWWTSRPEQVPPEGSWSVHLYLAGRGAGKTRSGAEWLVDRTLEYPYDSSGFPTERLVMAYNLSDTRTTCIEGASGILRVLERKGYLPDEGYHYVKSPKPRIILLESQAKIHFTGADPDAPRGFNLADVWMDEPCKWLDAQKVWREGIRPALRADVPGDKPRAFVTTTPKPIPLLQEWLRNAAGRVSVVRGSTFDNSLNLSSDFIDEVREMYEGTALGRQELYGEMLDAFEGALFSYEAIERHRMELGPEAIAHRTVGIDPGLTGDEDGDESGCIVVSRDFEDHMYVVADETVRLAGREAALHSWHVYLRYECDTLVYEENLGKKWMKDVYTDAFKELQRAGLFPAEIVEPPMKPVFSNYGKKLRAEPVAMRYSQGRVHHLNRFEKLEQQMLSFDPISSKVSPDRLDALVHACTHLMEGERRKSKVFSPVKRQISALQLPAAYRR